MKVIERLDRRLQLDALAIDAELVNYGTGIELAIEVGRTTAPVDQEQKILVAIADLSGEAFLGAPQTVSVTVTPGNSIGRRVIPLPLPGGPLQEFETVGRILRVGEMDNVEIITFEGTTQPTTNQTPSPTRDKIAGDWTSPFAGELPWPGTADPDYNCHNYAFGNRDDWWNEPLDHMGGMDVIDGDERVQPGDIILHGVDNNGDGDVTDPGELTHSGVVIRVDSNGDAILVRGKLDRDGIFDYHPNDPGIVAEPSGYGPPVIVVRPQNPNPNPPTTPRP
jgi:hypothetical protein